MNLDWAKTHLLLFLFLLASPLSADDAKADTAPPPSLENGYTINYNTVSIVQYIKFASKICNANFIYNESDLNFTVSVVSDAPVTPENVMATLLQVLRIHGMNLLEQDNNLVIHKSDDVKQIATLVTSGKSEGKAPIVTRIFRIKSVPVESIAAVIRPMISTSSLLETSTESRVLILTDITANVDKVASLIEILDSPPAPLEIKSYEIQYNSPEFLIDMASQLMTPIAKGDPFILVPQPLANTIFIVSTPDLIEKAKAILATLDSPPKKTVLNQRKLKSENIFVYKAMNRPGTEILSGLNEIANNMVKSGIPEGDLIETIETARFIPDTNSLIFFGSTGALTKVKEFLASLDTAGGGAESTKFSFFVYKPQYRSAEELEKAMLEMASNLKGAKATDEDLIDTIRSVKINPSVNTLVFSGEERTFPKIKDLLALMDGPNGQGSRTATPPSNQFFIYKPKHQKGEQISASIKEVAEDLKADQFTDLAFLQTLQSMKWVKANNSLLFTGDSSSIKKLEELVAVLDVSGSQKPFPEKTFFLHHAEYASREKTEAYLRQISDNLNKKTEGELIDTIRTMKWIEPSRSFMFQGNEAAVARLKELLKNFDTPAEKREKPGYYIYRLQNTNGEIVEDDLETIAKNFKSSGVKDTDLLDVIDNIRYVKETNSLLLTGDPKAIEEVKGIIAEYDHPRRDAALVNSSFFMYKPKNAPASQIEQSLKEVAANLKKADLADPPLLSTIHAMKYVETTNSLIFTGAPDSLEKVQTLLKDIDVLPQQHTPIQHVGKTTFLLYKLKIASGSQVLASLKAMTADLKKSGTSDKEFIAALQSAKYIKETHSLLFTGNEETLVKVQALVEKFDVPGLAGPPEEIPQVGGSDFLLYRPVSVPGPELEKMVLDFSENLRMSGLSDPDLFNAVHSMRWVEKTQSLIFTGTPKALDQVKGLLTGFDIPSNLPEHPPTAPLEPSIQAIDNTSFLVYKLQFHKGDEIQGALRQIAKDLTLSNAPVNQNLLNSINSIQWLAVTNSLLCSGDQETLVRLRELIKNLDIPLKQVYIEMLVIETSLSNALQFGLEWGSKYKYRNKFQGSMSNLPTPLSSQTACTPDTTMTTLNNLIPQNPPPTITQNIPFGCGFDLGIIGQVIKHNGATFLTLGSLLTAVQQDDETSVVITPKIITQDGRTSTIFFGQNIPFVGSFVQNQGSNNVQTSNLEYRDVGLNLTITPVLGNSDIVTLDISLDRTQTLTDVTGAAINFNSQSAQGITTSRTTMQTTVHVPDKNFLILSGFVNNSNVKNKVGIPCLGGLPFIGAAFSKDNTTVSNANIVIFLRPHIISSVDDLRRVTAEQEDTFRDQQGTPFLIQQFDEGMELIKSIDDE